ncbi:MAG: DUF4286 family protein [Bacteroidota bacterium]
MYIYNVTVSIEKSIAEEWLNWMKTIHVPDVLKTGYFTENKICRVLNVDDEGATFSVQYTFNHMADIEAYQNNDAKRLQADHSKRYEGKYAAFRTLLEIV